MIPSMLRVELLHPLFVHFPIALLIVGTAFRVFGFSFGLARPRGSFLHACARLMTVTGTIAAWAAYVTGNLAEEVVNGELCDPTLTHLHGDYALYVSILFSVVAVGDLLPNLLSKLKPQWNPIFDSRGLRTTMAFVSLIGVGLLGYVGHLGAGLVYQQGAGVYKPSAECKEFE